MSRGLDHIVHAVRDLDGAANLYRRLGFTVGARNRHPWGTHNHIVQCPGFFIELLTLGEPEKLGDDGFSNLFGRYTRDFLTRAEGFSLLILESKDARADEIAFRDAGIAASDTMRFEREGQRPDGSAVKVAFSLDFAEDKHAPDIHFAVCQQHYPENFWNPTFQKHANGATGVAGAVIVAADPAAHRKFISTFSGVAGMSRDANEIVAQTLRGEIAVMTPVGFHSAFGTTPPPTDNGARLAALRLTVADLAATADLLENENIAYAEGDTLVVGGATALGATIVFEPAKA